MEHEMSSDDILSAMGRTISESLTLVYGVAVGAVFAAGDGLQRGIAAADLRSMFTLFACAAASAVIPPLAKALNWKLGRYTFLLRGKLFQAASKVRDEHKARMAAERALESCAEEIRRMQADIAAMRCPFAREGHSRCDGTEREAPPTSQVP